MSGGSHDIDDIMILIWSDMHCCFVLLVVASVFIIHEESLFKNYLDLLSLTHTHTRFFLYHTPSSHCTPSLYSSTPSLLPTTPLLLLHLPTYLPNY